jgi:hypothetical protein
MTWTNNAFVSIVLYCERSRGRQRGVEGGREGWKEAGRDGRREAERGGGRQRGKGERREGDLNVRLSNFFSSCSIKIKIN